MNSLCYSIIPFYYLDIPHRLRFGNLSVTNNGAKIDGTVKINNTKISFVPNDELPSNSTINHKLEVYWEMFINEK